MDLLIYTGLPVLCFLFGLLVGKQLKADQLDTLTTSFAKVLASNEAQVLQTMNEVCEYNGQDLRKMSQAYLNSKKKD